MPHHNHSYGAIISMPQLTLRQVFQLKITLGLTFAPAVTTLARACVIPELHHTACICIKVLIVWWQTTLKEDHAFYSRGTECIPAPSCPHVEAGERYREGGRWNRGLGATNCQ